MLAVVAQVDEAPVDREDHSVLFYRDEDELVEAAMAYLGQALRRGEAVVVLATLTHRRAFEARLEAGGLDLGEARAAGTWLTLDAEATLNSMLDDQGEPEAARFDALVGAQLRRVDATGRAVSAYGEMVGVLWDAGRVSTAIALEQRWNALQDQVGFRLLCAYPATPVVTDGQGGARDEVCRLHSSVLGVNDHPQSARRSFPKAPDSPRAARRFVTGTLRAWSEGEVLIDDAALVVTELATNAVLHAGSAFSVEVTSEDDTVRISVGDRAAGLPARRGLSLAGSSGRGLSLVAELAERWGSERRDPGKIVWAELHRTPCPRPVLPDGG
jgi:anti-sigma regulatory factor (Ser/Thr protein kinase)